jgi:hypothetical protein
MPDPSRYSICLCTCDRPLYQQTEGCEWKSWTSSSVPCYCYSSRKQPVLYLQHLVRECCSAVGVANPRVPKDCAFFWQIQINSDSLIMSVTHKQFIDILLSSFSYRDIAIILIKSRVQYPMRWFFLTLPNPSSRTIPGVYSASNRKEYYKH